MVHAVQFALPLASRDVMIGSSARVVRELPSTKIALARLGVGHVEDATLLHAEVTHILRVLAACDGNRSLAATVLGIERRSLQRKLRDIDPERLFVIPGFRAPAGHKRGPKP